MNALLRAKCEWELANAKRLENLIELLKATAGLCLYLVWATGAFFIKAILSSETMVSPKSEELQNLRRFE